MAATSQEGRASSDPVDELTGEPSIDARPAVLLVGAIILIGSGLRAIGLAMLPGLHADEAANGFDVLAVLAGDRPIFFPANTGREPLFIYFQSLIAALIGLSPFSLRLASLIFGVATIPATYFAACEVFQWRWPVERARLVAAIASFVVATNCWHLYFSSFGLRLISLPFFELLTIGFLWRALRTGRIWPFAMAGLFGAATMYTYSASRTFPIVGLFALGIALLAKSDRRRFALVAMCLLIWSVGFSPLGLYFMSHPAEASLRAGSLSIFAPENAGNDPVRALIDSLARHVVVVVPSAWFTSAVAPQTNRSILDPASLLLAWLAVGSVAWRVLRRPGRAEAGRSKWATLITHPAVFCLVWILAMALPSIGTMNTPNYMRMIGSLPAFAMLAGYGAVLVLARLRNAPRYGPVAILCALALSAALNVSAWWSDWLATDRPADELGIKYEAGQRLAALAGDHRVYLAPLYFQDDAVRLGARARLNEIQTFDPQAPPVSVDRQAAYAFPAFDVEQPALLKARLGADLRFEEIRSASGAPLLTVGFAAPRAQQSTAMPLVSFADTIDLVEMRVEPAAAKAGEPVRVFLTWRARGPVIDDYTIFTHLRRGASETVAQTDVRPGKGRSLTYNWRPGDVLLDEVVINTPTDLSAGDYRVVAGLYRVATLQRLPAVASGKPVDGNEVEVGRLAIYR